MTTYLRTLAGNSCRIAGFVFGTDKEVVRCFEFRSKDDDGPILVMDLVLFK